MDEETILIELKTPEARQSLIQFLEQEKSKYENIKNQRRGPGTPTLDERDRPLVRAIPLIPTVVMDRHNMSYSYKSNNDICKKLKVSPTMQASTPDTLKRVNRRVTKPREANAVQAKAARNSGEAISNKFSESLKRVDRYGEPPLPPRRNSAQALASIRSEILRDSTIKSKNGGRRKKTRKTKRRRRRKTKKRRKQTKKRRYKRN